MPVPDVDDERHKHAHYHKPQDQIHVDERGLEGLYARKMQHRPQHEARQRQHEKHRITPDISLFLDGVDVDEQCEGHQHTEHEPHDAVGEIDARDERRELRHGQQPQRHVRDPEGGVHHIDRLSVPEPHHESDEEHQQYYRHDEGQPVPLAM